MTARLLPTLALCSAACCLLLCGLWAGSYWRAVGVDWPPEGHYTGTETFADVSRGIMLVGRGIDTRRQAGPVFETAPSEVVDWGAEYGGMSLLGFGGRVRPQGWMVWFPLWFPALLTALPPGWWARKRRWRGARGFEVATSCPRH